MHSAMARYLRSLRVAYWVEFIAAAVWLLPALGLSVLTLFMAPKGPLPGGFQFGGAVLLLTLGALGALPAVLVGLVLQHERRTRSGALRGAFLAFIFGFVFLGIISYFVFMTATVGGGGPMDLDFLVIGILIGATGLMQLGVGATALWGRYALAVTARGGVDLTPRPSTSGIEASPD